MVPFLHLGFCTGSLGVGTENLLGLTLLPISECETVFVILFETVSYRRVMSEKFESRGITEGIVSIYERLRSIVTSAFSLLLLIGWAGFWVAVARIHYLQQDWVSLLVTTALGAAPVVGVLIWSTPINKLGASVDG